MTGDREKAASHALDSRRRLSTLNRVKNRGYEYVRSMFSNRSDDIHAIFGAACDRAGVEWPRTDEWTTSVRKRESVENLDRFIGPKG